MSRSSIFSFESFEGFQPRLPATLLAVAGLLLALEIGLRLIPEERLIPPKSRQGEIFFMEREVLPKFDKPGIVLLGSSRVRRAVVPKMLDERLGLPPNSTLNIGLASGRIFEALYLYERNRERLGKARLVVLNLDEWHLSSGWRLGSLYEMHAPFSERLQFNDALRTRLLLDGIFSMRLRLRLLPGAVLSKRKSDALVLKLDENNQILPPARRGGDESADPAKFRETINTFYDRFDISPVLQGHVAALAKMVKEDGGKFVLMQLPNRTAYQSEVEKLHPQEYAAHVSALQELSRRLNIPLCLLDRPADCGLSESSYEDYGHINQAGAKVFTEFLAETIQREGWMK